MKKHYMLLLLILLGFSSCYNGFYTGETLEDFQIYSSPNSSEPTVTIPAGSRILYKKEGKGKYVACESYSGYTRRIKFRKYRKESFSEDQLLPYTKIYKASDDNYEPSKSYKSVEPTYNGGRVRVKGYYRKNGTYVRPHTRSAPHSGGRRR
ncbi:MAG: hypothetical protein WC756_04965 [Taibaiella sp.]|jgi:hypothetical protein